MDCPVCSKHALKPVSVTGVEVDRCRQCGGVWYDKGEFEKLVHVTMKDFRADRYAPGTARCCPRDSTPLKQMTYPQTFVVADVCPKCHGIWLDKGETREIRNVRQHLYRAGRLEKFAPIPGIKGKLIRWINASIDELTDYSKY